MAANAPWSPLSRPEQVKKFQDWLKKLLVAEVLGRTEDQLWTEFIERGFKQGQGRAFEDFKGRADPAYLNKTEDFYKGSKAEFLESSFNQPVSQEKVKLLSGRVLTELEGVTARMATRMGRSLMDSLVQGDGMYEAARALADEVNIGLGRAERIARTEIARVHSEGQLQALEDMGVEEIGVMVEWVTATPGLTARGNPSPCPRCASMRGVVLKLSEAQGLLPLHPN